METSSFKALSLQRLRGNRLGNYKETVAINEETFKETSQENWNDFVGAWRERARYWFEAEGLGLYEANYKAAVELNLLKFARELKLKKPEYGEGK